MRSLRLAGCTYRSLCVDGPWGSTRVGSRASRRRLSRRTGFIPPRADLDAASRTGRDDDAILEPRRWLSEASGWQAIYN